MVFSCISYGRREDFKVMEMRVEKSMIRGRPRIKYKDTIERIEQQRVRLW